MKTYSSMGNAKRAAKKVADKEGLDFFMFEFVKTEDGTVGFTIKRDEPAAPVAPAPPVVAPAKKATTRKRKDRECQNGVYKPGSGKCRIVWDYCDAIMQSKGCGTPTVAEVREKADSEGWNTTNAVIEYYNWRKFNGITGRVKKG